MFLHIGVILRGKKGITVELFLNSCHCHPSLPSPIAGTIFVAFLVILTRKLPVIFQNNNHVMGFIDSATFMDLFTVKSSI